MQIVVTRIASILRDCRAESESLRILSEFPSGCVAVPLRAKPLGNIDRASRASGEKFAQEKAGTLFKSTHVETNAGARTSAACKQLGVSFFGEEGLSPGTVGCSFDFVRCKM